MIKNIVFDIGNVLAAFRWKEYIAELGYEGEKAERLAAATTCNRMWLEVDRGIMTVNDIIDGCIASDSGLEPEIRHFFADRRRLVMEYDYSRDWLNDLKNRGYKIYILSNYSRDHFEYISRHFSFFGIEDGMLVSYSVGLLKPDPRIYAALFEKFGLVPEECVFLDDSEKNIEGAQNAGMKGIVFKDYEQGKVDLEKILAETK